MLDASGRMGFDAGAVPIIHQFPSTPTRRKDDSTGKERALSIVVANPRPLFRAGLVAILKASRNSANIGEAAHPDDVLPNSRQLLVMAGSLSDAAALAKRHGAVLLLDAVPPVRLAANMRALGPDCDEAAFVSAVLALADDLSDATGADGGTPAKAEPPVFNQLTTMQLRVLELIGQGLLNKQIAYRCSIAEATVKSHVSEIFRKLGVQRRSEAAILFTRVMLSSAGHERLPNAA